MRLFFIISGIVFLLLHSSGIAHPQTTIKGNVRDESGQPISYVNVYLRGTYDGGMSDEQGNFFFQPQRKGKYELVASFVGYRQYTASVDLVEGNTYTFNVVLVSSEVRTREIVVTASSFSTEEGKGLVLSPRDIVMTPGGAADIFQSLKTMPGITLVSESAELYVRGGDPTETITMLDNATLYHPYTFESSYGGLFSNINTSAVKGMYFSSGGFSARYGNALSGVLDLKTKSDASGPALQVGLSMANVSLSGEMTLFNNSLSLHIDGRQTLTRPMFAINGGLDRFPTIPVSRDADLLLRWKYSGSGSVKLVVFQGNDKEGVNVDLPEFSGVFDNTSSNTLINIYHEDIINQSVFISNSVSANRYKRTWQLGAMDIAMTEDVKKIRSDVSIQLTPHLNMQGGLETEFRETQVDGTIPLTDYERNTGAQTKDLGELFRSVRYGGFGEIEMSGLFGITALMLQAGVRGDYVAVLNQGWVDPRISLGYQLNEKTTFRISTGIFHQMFDPRSMQSAEGTSGIQPMKAAHLVLGTDYILDENSNLRCETYYKWYSHLPREISPHQYDNSGYGYACGIDLIAKGKLSNKLAGWVSYGFLNSKRLWMDYDGLLPSQYDITHNLTIILTYDIAMDWQVGLSAKMATGSPFTPVTGAEYHSDRNVYEPLYGATNSDRLPTYRRVDCRVTHYFQLFEKYFTVLYLECLNVLNLENIFGYTYSRDFSEKRVLPSYFGSRMIVIGGVINF
ncbi:MAG: TonB-dependent receptor [Bacteroidota bacterium]